MGNSERELVRVKKRFVLAEGYPNKDCYDSVAMLKVPWSTRTVLIQWHAEIFPSTKYRLILEEVMEKNEPA